MPTLVQTQQYNPGGSTSQTATLTPSPAVTSGNVMFAAVGFYNSVGPINVVPAGWTLVFATVLNGCALNIYQKTAGGSEPGSYAWSTAGTDFISAVFFEVSGYDTTYTLNTLVGGTANQSAAQTVGSPIPTLLNTLAIAIFATDEGTSSRTGASSVTTGWTLDQSAIPQFHAIEMAHKNVLTADTTTPVACTFTFTGVGTDDAYAMILINSPISFPKMAGVTSLAGVSAISF